MIREIPTNFNIPKTYRHEFVLRCRNGIMKVRRGGRRSIAFETEGDLDIDTERSLALDWIQETIERIRFDVSDEF